MPDWVKQGLTVGTENITGGGNKNIRMREYSISNYLGSRVELSVVGSSMYGIRKYS